MWPKVWSCPFIKIQSKLHLDSICAICTAVNKDKKD